MREKELATLVFFVGFLLVVVCLIVAFGWMAGLTAIGILLMLAGSGGIR